MSKIFNWRNSAIALALIAAFSVMAPSQSFAEDKDETPNVAELNISAEDVSVVEEAAEDGDVEAQTVLGAMYYSGEGVPQDFEKARKYLRLAADNGNTDAMVMLAELYASGKGGDEDMEGSIKLLVQAADKGNESAQKALQMLKEMAEEDDEDSESSSK